MNLAELEAEAMLLGIWRNIAELEENISLPELEAILVAGNKKEQRHNEFMAALKGIDLNKNKQTDAKERFDEVQRRVEAKLTGADERQLELDIFGTDIEIDE